VVLWWRTGAVPAVADGRAANLIIMWLVAGVAISDWLSQTRSSLLPSDGALSASASSHLGTLLVLLVLLLLLLPLALNTLAWVLWILVGVMVGLGRAFYVVFVFMHIIVDVWCLSAMKTVYTVYRYVTRYYAWRAAAAASVW